MDCYSDHSAILDYLAQVEQEEELRESFKSKSGIAALRVERGEPCLQLHAFRGLCSELYFTGYLLNSTNLSSQKEALFHRIEQMGRLSMP